MVDQGSSVISNWGCMGARGAVSRPERRGFILVDILTILQDHGAEKNKSPGGVPSQLRILFLFFLKISGSSTPCISRLLMNGYAIL